MNYYFCDACKYCFPADTQPDRCPDCGAVMVGEKSAVRSATENEKYPPNETMSSPGLSKVRK